MSHNDKATKQVKKQKKTKPEADIEKYDANVGNGGYCTMVQDGEMARPNSGDPCDDGRGGGAKS